MAIPLRQSLTRALQHAICQSTRANIAMSANASGLIRSEREDRRQQRENAETDMP